MFILSVVIRLIHKRNSKHSYFFLSIFFVLFNVFLKEKLQGENLIKILENSSLLLARLLLLLLLFGNFLFHFHCVVLFVSLFSILFFFLALYFGYCLLSLVFIQTHIYVNFFSLLLLSISLWCKSQPVT